MKKVVVGLSGGVDSVALALMLESRRQTDGFTIVCAHMNHMIRDNTADRDEDYVREFCKQHDIDFMSARADIPARAREMGEGLETAARAERHAYLARVRRETGADRIALAHHAGDQAETVLMHILRGAGLNGAGAMAADDGNIIRPLLAFSKAELTEYVKHCGETWVEDETNFEADNPRNALRINVLPEIEKIYPGAFAALGRFAEICRRDDACLRSMASDWMRKNVRPFSLGWVLENFDSAPESVQVRAVMALSGVCDAGQVMRLCREERVHVAGVWSENAGGRRYIYRDDPDAERAYPLALQGETHCPGVVFSAAQCEPVPVKTGFFRQVVARESMEGAVIRRRRAGDRIMPFGMKKEKLLSDYLTDRHVPRPERDGLWLAARENEILWVFGVGISEKCRVQAGIPALDIECNEIRRVMPDCV